MPPRIEKKAVSKPAKSPVRSPAKKTAPKSSSRGKPLPIKIKSHIQGVLDREAGRKPITPIDAVQVLLKLCPTANVSRTDDRSYSVNCFGHDDANPSLSITATDDKILLNCHTSCTAKKVVEAIDKRIKEEIGSWGHKFSMAMLQYAFSPNGEANLKGAWQKLQAKLAKLPDPVLGGYGSRNNPGNKSGESASPEKWVDVPNGEYYYTRTRTPDNPANARRIVRQHDANSGDPPSKRFHWRGNGEPECPYGVWSLNEGSDAPVYLVEGEKDVEVAHDRLKLEVLSSKTWNSGWAEEYLAGRDVVIVMDNDETGFSVASNVLKFVEPIANSVRWFDINAHHPVYGADLTDLLVSVCEIDDVLSRQLGGHKLWPIPDAKEASMLKILGRGTVDERPEVATKPVGPDDDTSSPRAGFNLADYIEPIEIDELLPMLPKPWSERIRGEVEVFGTDPLFSFVGGLTALAGANRSYYRLKGRTADEGTYTNVWLVAVSASGNAKSTALRAMTRILLKLDERAVREYEAAKQAHAKTKKAHEMWKKENTARQGPGIEIDVSGKRTSVDSTTKGSNDVTAIATQPAPTRPGPEPRPPRRMVMKRFTGEALKTRFSTSRAVAALPDEGAGLTGRENAYRNGRGGDRQDLLEAYSNDTIIDDTEKHGTVVAKDVELTICTTIQPKKAEVIADGEEDGFAERFCYFRCRGEEYRDPFAAAPSYHGDGMTYDEWVTRVWEPSHKEGDFRYQGVDLSPEAYEVVRRLDRSIYDLKMALSGGRFEVVCSWTSKCRDRVKKLCGLIHAGRFASGEVQNPYVINEETALCVEAVMRLIIWSSFECLAPKLLVPSEEQPVVQSDAEILHADAVRHHQTVDGKTKKYVFTQSSEYKKLKREHEKRFREKPGKDDFAPERQKFEEAARECERAERGKTSTTPQKLMAYLPDGFPMPTTRSAKQSGGLKVAG